MLKYERFESCDFTFFEVESETPFSDWLRALASYEKAGMTAFELFDMRRLTIHPTEQEIRQIITQDQKTRDRRPVGSKTAIVINTPMENWWVRFYSILSKVINVNWETKGFFSITEAVTWLGIDLPDSLNRKLDT